MHNRRGIRRSRFQFAVLAALSSGASTSFANVTSSWLTANSGTWAQAARWTTNPVIPNGATFDAVIAASGSDYLVEQTSAITVNSLTVSSPSVQVNLGSPFYAPIVTVNAGTMYMSFDNATGPSITVGASGHLYGSRIPLNGATLSGPMVFNVSTFSNGLTLNNGGILFDPSSGVSFNGGSQMLGGTGTVGFVFGTNSIGAPTTLTIGSGITIQSVGGDGQISGLWNNRGTILASSASNTITFAGNWTNTGTVQLTAGTLVLNGAYDAASANTVKETGDTLIFAGSLDNRGKTLNFGGGTGFSVMGAQVNGGTIACANDSTARLQGDLFNVTLAGSFWSGGGSLFDSLHLANGAHVFGVGFQGMASGTGTTVVLDGNGTLQLNGGSLNAPNLNLQIGPQVLVTGNGRISAGTVMTNYGTITADAGSMTIGATNSTWFNSGSLRAINGGSIRLVGNVLPSQIGDFASDAKSSVVVAGTLDNSNHTLILSQPQHSLRVEGFLRGGTVSVDSGATLAVSAGTVQNAYLDSDLYVIQNFCTLSHSQIAPNRVVHFTTTDSGLTIDDDLASGLFQFESKDAFLSCNPNASSTQFSIDPGITVRTAGGWGLIYGANTGMTLINQGMIVASAGGSITLGGSQDATSSFQNQGTISLNAGGQVRCNFPLQNAGTIICAEQTVSSAGQSSDFAAQGSASNSNWVALGPADDLNVTGKFTQFPTATLDLAVTGLGSEQFGQVNATGFAAIAGTLKLELPYGYEPHYLDTFKIINSTAESGSFSAISYPGQTASHYFLASYAPNGVTLTYVPEPAAAANLLLLGAARFLCQRRRRIV